MVKMRALMDEKESHGVELGMRPTGVLGFDLISNIDGRNLINKRGMKLHDFELAGEIEYEGRKAYVVRFDQKDKVKIAAYKGEMYIDAEDLAFVYMEFGFSPKGVHHARYGDAATRAMLTLFGLNIDMKKEDFRLIYKRQGSRYYLQQAINDTWINLSSEREFYNFPTTAHVEYVVTSIDSTRTEPFSSNEVMGNSKIFENQFSEYDSSFWENYNIILPDFDFKEISESIEASNEGTDFKREMAERLRQLPKSLTTAARIDSILSFYHAKGGFNGSALVARGDEVLFQDGFGFADKQSGSQNSAMTMHRIGSTAKTFTTMLVMQLVEAGKLSVEDRVSKFFPNYIHGEVTVHQLMNHTSGIPTYEHSPQNVVDLMKRTYPIDSLIDLFASDSLLFKPGTDFDYSNSGFLILAGIVEQVSGQSFAEVLEQRIFKPLQLDATEVAYPKTGSAAAESTSTANSATNSTSTKEFPRAQGYLYGDPETYYPFANTIGAGAMTSNVQDLFKWSRAIDKREGSSTTQATEGATTDLLKDSTKELLFAPHAEYQEWESYYGYGWMIDRYNFGSSKRNKIVLHPGTDMGFYSMFVKQLEEDPAESLTIILLSNHGHFPRFDITDLLLKELN